MKKISFIVLFMLPIITCTTYRVIKAEQFYNNCSGHLKNAASTSTIEMAIDELEDAVKYLEEKELIDGYTTVFTFLGYSPSDEINFFYAKIKNALKELKALPPDALCSDKCLMLLKLRQTLMNGNVVDVPCGISIHPYTQRFAVIFFMSLCFSLLSLRGNKNALSV